ncbi:hypothetical protein DIPPA_28894 [Diplonema papillatum]|nr:hypothetical protein DIPPA_28894 [Diplonema papillatum]
MSAQRAECAGFWREVWEELTKRSVGEVASRCHAILHATSSLESDDGGAVAARLALVPKDLPQPDTDQVYKAKREARSTAENERSQPPPASSAAAELPPAHKFAEAGDILRSASLRIDQQRIAKAKRTEQGEAQQVRPRSVKQRKLAASKLLLAVEGWTEVWEWRYTGQDVDIGRDWSCLPPWVSSAVCDGVKFFDAMHPILTEDSLGKSAAVMREQFQKRDQAAHSSGTPRAVVVPLPVLKEMEAVARIADNLKDKTYVKALTHLALHTGRLFLCIDKAEDGTWLLTESWRPEWITSQLSTESVTSMPPGIPCEVRKADMSWESLPP